MLPKRVYASINLDNIQSNVKPVLESCGCEVMGIVKADAYGHGAVEVSKALAEIGVTQFGVATVGEACELRRNGITEPILVLGQVFYEEFPALLKYDIISSVFDIHCAIALSREAVKLGKKAKVYIKLDTGMGRLGFQTNADGANRIKVVYDQPGLEILGAFTHFACADQKDKTSAIRQREFFNGFCDALESTGIKLPVRHCYNSASIMELDRHEQGSVVRCGIMMYGLYPSEEMDRSYKLYPAMEIKSSIAFIKDVPKGFKISYGSTYTTPRKMKIATIPVGYADGYPRYLSNKGAVLINGRRCPILGRVCMDQFMVDITGMESCMIGDSVTLLGRDVNEEITIDELADPDYRFNYEFCCLITRRVPRVYIKHGKVYKICDAYADE